MRLFGSIRLINRVKIVLSLLMAFFILFKKSYLSIILRFLSCPMRALAWTTMLSEIAVKIVGKQSVNSVVSQLYSRRPHLPALNMRTSSLAEVTSSVMMLQWCITSKPTKNKWLLFRFLQRITRISSPAVLIHMSRYGTKIHSSRYVLWISTILCQSSGITVQMKRIKQPQKCCMR